MKAAERADAFAKVYTEVNKLKSKAKKPKLERSDLNGILKAFKIEKTEWYYVLSHAKKTTPNLHALFMRAFGRDVGDERPEPAAADEAPLLEQTEVEASPAEEATDPADALANILAWLKGLATPDRQRVVGAVNAFYPAA